MHATSPPPNPTPKPSLLGVLTVTGDMIMLSLGLLVLWLGFVTAAPGSAAAIDARQHIGFEGPSHPLRALFAGTKRHFRHLWFVGPIVTLIGIFIWIGLAFWITVDPPFGPIMLAVVLIIAFIVGLLALALPSAATQGRSLREALITSAQLIASRPFASILALAAAGAAWILAGYLPTIGIVAIGGAMIEIGWRAWGRVARA